MTSRFDVDVAIAGGGPAGSTLAALLARQTDLSVLVLEREEFPRDHIGESFAQRVTSALAESGALEKLLASDCWVRKYGGFYAWDPGDPAVSLFEHDRWEQDGILRWTVHANRAEMDQILLDHAASCGASVRMGVEVVATRARPPEDGGGHVVELSTGETLSASLVIEATGRHTRLTGRTRKEHLSSYRNVALWTHVTGGNLTQSLSGEWNLFRRLGVSGIGNFAFPDGWFWYIPVPRIVDGKRVLTHSLGMVTDPRVLKEKNYRDMDTFMETARSVPLLAELLDGAEPSYDGLQTATNYSMISERFGSFEERWLLLGDAAFFVDPLFSSGVAFGTTSAVAAARLIEATFDERLSAEQRADLWTDYEQKLKRIARSFALLIDQWYHAIAENHPDSIYWSSRAGEPTVDLRHLAFRGLVNTDISPDLNLVIARGKELQEAFADGPLVPLWQHRSQRDGATEVSLKDGVVLRESLALPLGASRSQASATMDDDARLAALSLYWSDPVRYADRVPSISPPPLPCGRLSWRDDPEKPHVTFTAMSDGHALLERLRSGPQKIETLRDALTPAQHALLDELSGAEMLEFR